jgi:hypothetical protein
MALTINVCERDRVYTWADLKPRRKNADLVAYEIARDTAQETYRNWCKKVDTWIERREYDEMNEQEDECKRLELHAQQLYKQLYCEHPDEALEEIGQDVLVGGEWYHRTHLICRNCGKEFRNKEK